ncbi:MAG: hypothetical protein J3T61_05495 [Candidatus Brocadiales bacterium]|nr:hypothetical protein [Candidatus Bathyanammoxibius sp.]
MKQLILVLALCSLAWAQQRIPPPPDWIQQTPPPLPGGHQIVTLDGLPLPGDAPVAGRYQIHRLYIPTKNLVNPGDEQDSYFYLEIDTITVLFDTKTGTIWSLDIFIYEGDSLKFSYSKTKLPFVEMFMGKETLNSVPPNYYQSEAGRWVQRPDSSYYWIEP